MAPRTRRVSALPSSPPISIGNCEVTVEAKNFTSETHGDSVQISLSKTAKIRISVVEKVNEHDGFEGGKPDIPGACYFVLANPKDSDGQTRSLLQDIANLYMKELPAMNYAVNTGKESMFLERCVTNGKYCTLILKSKDDKQPGEVIAAITYQIVPADTQYAEIPLAVVKSNFQRKGIGRLLYLELKKRLLSVGIRTLFCWGDKESEGFWLKQGFTVIGEVDKKGKARRLPIKADIRRALCFPGGSSLMASHLLKDCSSESVPLVLYLPVKPPARNSSNSELRHIVEGHDPPTEYNRISENGCPDTEKFSVNGFQDAGLLPVVLYGSGANASGIQKGKSGDDEDSCSSSVQGTKKRIWEASCTSLKSKKVKGTRSDDCQLGSHCPVWTSDGRIVNYYDRNCSPTSANKFLPDALLTSSENCLYGKNEEWKTGNITDENYGCQHISSTSKCCRILLMNIADDNKRSFLTKIIEDLGGVVASDGSEVTHVITGKARKTLNFCTALCSGAWVITSGWLKESFRKGSFVDETPFILDDEDYRTKYKIELKTAVLRAKANPNALLKGLDIWLATHVQPPANTLSAIIKSAGGNVIRTQNEMRYMNKTIFVACEEDMEEALSVAKMGILTFSSDWLMNCIMRQELDIQAPQFAESL